MMSHGISWLDANSKALGTELNGAAKAPFNSLRDKALNKLQNLGLPSSKSEEWRYTNIEPLAKGAFSLARRENEAIVTAEQVAPHLLSALAGPKLVFVDGFYSERLSSPTVSESGISVEPLEKLLHGEGENQKLIEAHLARYTPDSSIASLNTGFVTNGVFVRVSKNAQIKEAVQILFVSSGTQKDALSFPRLLIVAEENSSCTIIESYVGVGGESYLVSAVSEVVLAEGASVTQTKIQNEGLQSYHLGLTAVKHGKASRYTSNLFHFGGKIVRNEIHPTIDGEGVESYLNGLTAVTGTQHIDNYTVIDHAKPNSFSREVYKGVYDEKSAGVFCGTIIVREDAQKTNAIQSNKSILLSDTATIDTKPQLKIWADDVKCTHGATIGQLDDHALFYLRSRGIPEDTARGMLIHAFASEVIYSIEDDLIREHLEGMLMAKLGAKLA